MAAAGAADADAQYSIADQVARFAKAKTDNNQRYLDITTVYDGTYLNGKRVLITGAEQNLGLETLKEVVGQGGQAIAVGRTSSEDLDAFKAANPDAVQIITGIDVTDDAAMAKMVTEMEGKAIDILINNAGYFYGPYEEVGVGGKEGHLNFNQELLMINICAVGPLRITSALYKAGLLVREGSPGKVIIITSQAGSCEWRKTQNKDEGGNYGHHMSRASCNIMGVLLSEEFKGEGIAVQLLHPGFNRTSMTQKYSEIWDIEGAVPASEGAKRVLYEVGKASMETTGTFVNCEDGLLIPW